MSIYTGLSLSLISFFLLSCGVKGNPQPPLESPILGRGEMNQVKKSNTQDPKKKKFKSIEPDWEESDDFLEDKN